MNTEYKLKINNILWHIVLIAGALTMVIPFVWMVLTSFKTFAETIHVPIIWLPSSFRFDNYAEVLERLNFGRYYLNTIYITIVITLGQLFLCSLAAYAFARLEFPGRDFLFIIILTVLMVPPQMTLISRFLLINFFGWVDTFWALIVPNMVSAYGTFFLRQFFKTLPGELEDSAKIDGCSYFRIFWNIMLPLCTSSIIAFGIFTVLWAWNDLLWPLIVTTSEAKRVLSVGIATLQGQHDTEYHLLMSASVMATIPMVAVFLVGQKYFIEGIAVSGIKS